MASDAATLAMASTEKTRRHHHKTRSGCITCRRRRVKCDEGTPSCMRCKKSGRSCEGYDTPVPWIFEHQPPKPSSRAFTFITYKTTASSANTKTSHSNLLFRQSNRKLNSLRPTESVSAGIPRALSVSINGTQVDRYKYNFYIRYCHTTIEVADETDVELFSRIIPQAGFHVPAIRSAVLTIASYVESLLDMENASRHRLYAEYNYTKVLKETASMHSAASGSNWVEILLLSMLLRCLETHRNDYDRAVMHLRGALGIIQEHHCTSRLASLDSCIQRLIDRVISKPTIRQDQAVTQANSPLVAFALSNSITDRFCKSLALSGSICDSELERNELVRETIAQIDQCISCIQAMRVKCGPTASLIASQIQNHISRLVLSTLTTASKSSFAKSTAEFREILDLCFEFDDLNNGRTRVASSNGYQLRLGVGTELVTSVLFVATECGDRQVREAAISLLRSSFRQEWLWDSFQAAQVAEWLKDKQNGYLSLEDVAPKSRPVLVSASFYRESYDSASQFRRPVWACLKMSKSGRLTKHWLFLHQPTRCNPTDIKPLLPKDPVLCYTLPGRMWPSTASAIAKAYEKAIGTL